MKKSTGVFIIIVLCFMIASLSAGPLKSNNQASISQDTTKKYTDGKYKGMSRAMYTDEPYWGIAEVTIVNGLIAEVSFSIRDSALHENFDSGYEKHFAGKDVYIQQCRNDWKGVQTYPGKLLEAQNNDKVDAMSGATWSCNIFNASVVNALSMAKRKSD